jgi:hypothetical protein
LELDPTGATPAWETAMAAAVPHTDGDNGVIAFNWVSTSALAVPGQAVAAGNQLYQQVVSRADQLASAHPGDVVDVQFIGHSRGAVVISQALQDLEGTTDPALKGAYLRMTLLDPHPANNQVGSEGQLWDALPNSLDTNLLDPIAQRLVNSIIYNFQANAADPNVIVPNNVNEVDLYYQQNHAADITGGISHYLNLWGESPFDLQYQAGLNALIHTPVNLTGFNFPGFGYISHTSIEDWYTSVILPQNIWS